MENLGHIPYYVAATVQPKSYNHIQGTQKTAIAMVLDCYSAFHKYVLEWESGEMRIFVDSQLYLTFKT